MVIKKYLDYSCDEINITDKHDENINQSSDFIDHRHDQSIFSLLYKKYNLQPFKDPCQLGKYPKGYGAMNEDKLKANELHFLKNGRLFREKDYKEDYTLVMYHNRKGKPIISFFKYKIKELLFKINLYNGNIR